MRKLYHSEQGTSSKFGHNYFALALTAAPKDRYNQYTYILFTVLPFISTDDRAGWACSIAFP
jgi:hypothetical protein